MTTQEYDFTYNQAIEITRHLWKGVYEPFILSFAETLHEKGYQWLTNEFIDIDEAEWITNYLKNK